MTPEEIAREREENLEYWSMSNGDILRGYFVSNEFVKEMKKGNDGKVFTKYKVKFCGKKNGGKEMIKDYSCSDYQVQVFTDSALMVEQSFLETIFAIKKSGEGMSTEYNIQVIGKREKESMAKNPVTEIFKGKEVTDENIPF